MTEQTPAQDPLLSRSQAVEMTLLGLDWGRRRMGLAIKHAGRDWALPKAVLTPTNEQDAIEQLRGAIEQSRPGGVVVGLPIHPDPSRAQEIKRFCRRARQGLRGVRWFFADERLTTEAADSISMDRPAKRPTDDLAAVMILETFLQSCH